MPLCYSPGAAVCLRIDVCCPCAYYLTHSILLFIHSSSPLARFFFSPFSTKHHYMFIYVMSLYYIITTKVCSSGSQIYILYTYLHGCNTNFYVFFSLRLRYCRYNKHIVRIKEGRCIFMHVSPQYIVISLHHSNFQLSGNSVNFLALLSFSDKFLSCAYIWTYACIFFSLSGLRFLVEC